MSVGLHTHSHAENITLCAHSVETSRSWRQRKHTVTKNRLVPLLKWKQIVRRPYNDITNAELGLEGYVMFRKDRMGRRGGGVLLYIKETIPAYEVQLQEEADCKEAIWCKLVTGHTTVTIGVVYRCPNITKQNNENIHNAISEVSKGDCIIMGDFKHGNIKWDTLQSTGVEDQQFLCLIQDNFLTQYVLEPTRAARILDIVLSSQKEFVDNVVIQEPLGSSDHNQLHFNIKIKSVKTKVNQCRRDFRKGNYKEIRKRLAHIDWNDKMKNKTATECWIILRGEIDIVLLIVLFL